MTFARRLSSLFATVVLLFATVVLLFASVVFGLGMHSIAWAVEPSAGADDLLAAAFDAQLKGDNSSRDGYLQKALSLDPDHPIARSLLGQIHTPDGWVDVEQAAADAIRDPVIRDYQVLRLRAQGTPQGQAILARYCSKHQLHERANFHWRMVLMRQPRNKEAAAALNLQIHKGRLINKDRIAEFDERAAKLSEWSAKVEDLKAIIVKAAESSETKTAEAPAFDAGAKAAEAKAVKEKAAAKIAAIRDHLAIPALAKLSSSPNAQAAMAAISALAAMEDPASTSVLATQATLHPAPTVRALAKSALKNRTLHEYVPQLLGALTTPIQVTGNIRRLDDNLVYSISTSREGAQAEFINQTYGSTTPNRPGRRPGGRVRRVAASAATVQRQFQTLQRQAAIRNQRGQMINQRVFETLRESTGQELENQPQEWWNWWAQYNDLYQPQDKPQIVNYRRRDISILSCECFLAGTLVWTDLGRRPIEQLRAGDRVLTCEPESGRISYRYILTTTVRPSLETSRIELPGEDVVLTDGHPLWVLGKGWRMAKNIQIGDRLHGVRGAVEVQAVGRGPGADVYNLVVDGVNNYFVGANGVLSHDNTIRQLTRADMPGHIAVAKPAVAKPAAAKSGAKPAAKSGAAKSGAVKPAAAKTTDMK